MTLAALEKGSSMLVPFALLMLAAADKAPHPADIDQESLAQLLIVPRVFVDRFSGGETASAMPDMILRTPDCS